MDGAISPQLAIILLSPLIPAAAVGHILYKGGKTMGYALFGGVITYVVSIGFLYILFKLWVLWPNMPFQAFLLIMPIAIAGLFAWQLKGHGPDR